MLHVLFGITKAVGYFDIVDTYAIIKQPQQPSNIVPILAATFGQYWLNVQVLYFSRYWIPMVSRQWPNINDIQPILAEYRGMSAKPAHYRHSVDISSIGPKLG